MTLRSTLEGDVLTLALPSNLAAFEDPRWQELTSAWLMEPAQLYVLDFRETQSIERAAYRNLIDLCRVLETNQKKLASLGLSAKLLAEVRTLGLDRPLNPVDSVDQALARAGIKVSPAALVVAEFGRAIKMVFETQAATPCRPRPPVPAGRPNDPVDTSIAGVLTIAAVNQKGTIALLFPAATFLQIYANMLGEPPQTEITNDLKDAASELLNITYGVVKADLSRADKLQLPLAIPTVISGQNLSVRQASRSPAVLIPIDSDAGLFHVEIAIDFE